MTLGSSLIVTKIGRVVALVKQILVQKGPRLRSNFKLCFVQSFQMNNLCVIIHDTGIVPLVEMSLSDFQD